MNKLRKNLFIKTLKTVVLFFFLILLSNTYVSAEGWSLQSVGRIDLIEEPVIARDWNLYFLMEWGYEKIPINKDGTLGQTELILDDKFYGNIWGAVATTKDWAITTGGGLFNRTGRYTSSQVQIISFKNDGSIDTVKGSNYGLLGFGRKYHGSIVVNNFLYAMGGYYSEFIDASRDYDDFPTKTVEYGHINSDHSIGPFVATSQLNDINGYVYAVWYSGNTIYCFGSCGAIWIPNATCVERAIILEDGSLSQWTTCQGPFPFYGQTVLTKQNTLFMVQNYGSNYNNCVKAQIDGKLKHLDWVVAPHAIFKRTRYSLATWDRYIYLIGGWTQYSNSLDNTIEMYDPNLTATELYDEIPSMITTMRPIKLENF